MRQNGITDKTEIRCTQLQNNWVCEYIDSSTSALTAGLNPAIKTAIAGLVDEMEQDALRVEHNSTHIAIVRGVNTATVKVY